MLCKNCMGYANGLAGCYGGVREHRVLFFALRATATIKKPSHTEEREVDELQRNRWSRPKRY